MKTLSRSLLLGLIMVIMASGLPLRGEASVINDGQDKTLTINDVWAWVASQPIYTCVNPKRGYKWVCGASGCTRTEARAQAAAAQGGASDANAICYAMVLPNGSLIDTITLTHHQIAEDYQVGQGSASCATGCGGSAGSGSGLMNLVLERRHRYRDMTTYSSFGPGVYCSYDTKLNLYEYDGGIMADLFEPYDIAPRRFVDGLDGDTQDGVLVNLENKGFKNITLYDATDTAVSSLASADKAVLTSYDGKKHTFELIELESFSGIVGGQSTNTLINPSALPSTSLIAHWEFDENTGTTAGDSAGSYDGTIAGASWVGTSGAPSGGSALSFDGVGDDVRVGNVPVGSAGGAAGGFTAAFWVKAGTQIRNNPAMISKVNGGSGEKSFIVDRYKIGGKMRFTIYPDGSTAETLISPQQVLIEDKWQHVAVTYDGSYQRIYVNGQQVAQSEDRDASFATARSSDLVIGGNGNTADYNANRFVGEMDDVRLYSRALTGAEIQAMMQRELLASYAFEENAGTTTADGSGNGNTGTLFGGAAWTSSGLSGNAIDFDGTDDGVNLGHDPSILSGHWITVSAWVKPDTLANASTGDGSRNIVARDNGVFLRIKDGEYQFGTSSVGFIAPAKFAAPSGDVGEWVHLTGTYDGQWWRLYRNGVLVAEQVEARGTSANDDDWVVGNIADGSRPFDGVIDSVAIYNDALSADEVAAMAELPIKGGRLVKIEDRNGYAINLTYRDGDFTAQQLIDAPDRRWQINTVTDAYGRTATFHYKAVQESGRWVVEKIDLPNGADVDYTYTDGKLAAVDHADGTQSTIAYGVNSQSQTTTVTYADASAKTTHRNKTVYLTNVAATFGLDSAELYSQSSLMVRGVINGENEVSFMAIPQDDYKTLIYTGKGKLYEKYKSLYARPYADDWEFNDPDDPSAGISGTLETTYASADYSHSNTKTGVYPTLQDDAGVEYTYQYDDDTFVTRKFYSDNTREYWDYNQFKQVTRYEDRLGRVTKYTYDANGNLTQKEMGIANVKIYQQSFPITWERQDKHVTIANGFDRDEYALISYSYYDGSEGPAVSGITGAAATQPENLLKSKTDARGNVTHYVYNSDKFLIAEIQPADRPGDDRATTLYAYDSARRLASVTDPLGRETSFTYDSRDRVKTVTYADTSTTVNFYANELPGGAGTLANLLVATKDRNGNYTQYRYDDQGRRVMTIRGLTSQTDALNQSFVPDSTYHDIETCTYLDGTDVKVTCVRNGEKTEYTYDYRHRLVATTVHPRDDGTFPSPTALANSGADSGTLTNRTVYRDNLRFATVDPYGRATFYAYRATDSALIRTVTETVPGGSGIDPDTGTFAQVLNLTRDLSYEDASSLASSDLGGAAYLITDRLLDDEGQVVADIDPRNVQTDTAYDSRGRMVSMTLASGTAVEATTETVYDAQSNVVEQRSPRYFDTSDTQGYQKAYTTMTYTGRNLLASRTVAAGDSTYNDFVTASTGNGAKATEVMYYYLDGRAAKTVDFNGNDAQFTAADHEWITVWRFCCERVRAQIDPAGNGRTLGHDLFGNVTHTATVADLKDDLTTLSNGSLYIPNSDNGGPGIWDVPDARTLAEATTLFDSRNRPIASTTWLEPLGEVDPNDVPILYGSTIVGGTKAQSAASGLGAGDGLTTLYYYSEDLSSSTTLEHEIGPDIDLTDLLAELAADGIDVLDAGNTNASAQATVSPEGDISVTVTDGVGRAVISAMLDPTSHDPVTWSTISHDRISTATSGGFGNTLETLRLSALNHAMRSRTDGVGRTIESEDAENEVAWFVYDNAGNPVRSRDANGVGLDCDYDARSRQTVCVDTEGDQTETAYNAESMVINRTDAKNVSLAADTVYDARGRVLATTTRLDASDTTFRGYDPNSNLLTLTDAEGGVTTYHYDARNLRIAEDWPGHNPASSVGDSDYDRTEMTYDAMSRPQVKTDQLGDTVVFTFDMASRLTQRDYRTYANSGDSNSDGIPDGTIADSDTFAYDADSRMLTATSGRYANTVTLSYDEIGRTETEALTIGGQTYTVTHTYDADNRMTNCAYPAGDNVARTYTDRNQLATVAFNSNNVATFAYDDGQRESTRTLGNSLVTTRTYNDDNTTAGISVAGRADLSFTYGYDVNKNVTSETSTGTVMSSYATTVGFDAKDRLDDFDRANGDSQDWTLSFESDWLTTSGLLDGNTFSETRTTMTSTKSRPSIRSS
jgi:YD repeat-containing protein